MNKCGKLYPRNDECDRRLDPDTEGCIKPYGHFGDCVFITEKGTKVSWCYDENCKCGCQKSDTFEDVCILYTEEKIK